MAVRLLDEALSLRGASIIQVEGDKIASDHTYFDRASFDEQLTLKPANNGGQRRSFTLNPQQVLPRAEIALELHALRFGSWMRRIVLDRIILSPRLTTRR